MRAEARGFFGLPAETKQRYAVTVGGRGWLPPGVEANGYAEGTATPPDLKESFAVGADQPTGDPAVDGYWFQPNVYPAEIPGLAPAVVGYLAAMRSLADELLVVCAAALGLETDFFTRHTGHATHTLNVNWYPPMTLTGAPEPGQYRIGPHTDFGTVTVLDREPGRGGLQVWTEDGGWEDAPYQPGAFTINTGDLLARWSGSRWKSNRHRVLPPQAEAPDEDLVSLVILRDRPRRGDRSTAAAARQAERLRAGGVGGVPEGAAGRDHRRLVLTLQPGRGQHRAAVHQPDGRLPVAAVGD